MIRFRRSLVAVLAGIWLCTSGVHTQQPPAPPKPTLYVVSTSHLDTQWNWTVQDTIRQFVPATFYDNFKLFERFPNYTFTWEGVIHYMWFKEYHPADWPTVQQYVARGRWKLAGSWIDAVDTNVPSPEALMRQALYGKRFFRQEFGHTSQDIYLPDCFGFGFALPSIGAHSGLRAFSTQKLTWGAAKPAPFAVGLWKGVDGSTLVAALRPGDYVASVTTDMSTDPKWNGDLVTLSDGKKIGLRYFGTGDQGGAPDAASVEWVEKALANKGGAVEVRNTSADQLARDLGDAERASLPTYEGELLLKTHGVGCYTSQAAMKMFNRRNELLADAAERASVAAEWVGGPAYPRERLRTAWTRFLWHQFHDDVTGTSIPQAYQFSWNDELISLNQFASMTTDALSAVASGLDTRATSLTAPAGRVSLVVYNPLGIARTDLVEATVPTPGPVVTGIRVVDTTNGRAVPAQVLESTAGSTRLLFLADVPAVAFKVFEAAPVGPSISATSGLKVTSSSLENGRYAVKIDANGDVASVYDKEAGTELLKGPARLELFEDPSYRWPAWEVLWETVSRPPREYPTSPVVTVVERGPARVAVEVTRKAAGSTFVQRISLAQGGDRVEFDTRVDWRSPGTLLKASFPLTAGAPLATFDLGLGTIDRPNETPDQYEVPAQQWADLTDASGRYGAAILNDSKYGWDKPGDHELRLTLIHTPRPGSHYVYQSSNDIGRHHFTYAIAGHAGTWRDGRVPSRASRLNQPLMAFVAPAHDGPLGRSLALLDLGDASGQVAVRAVKKAEDSDEIVVRVQELYGRPAAGVQLSLGSGLAQAREINAAEEKVRDARLRGNKLVFDLKPYQPRTFAVVPLPSPSRVPAVVSSGVTLPYNLDGFSPDDRQADGDFDGHGRTYPAELFPEILRVGSVAFKTGPTAADDLNVVAAQGQRVALPAGTFNRLYLLASAVGGDVPATFTIERRGGAPLRAAFTIQDWTGAIGQWNNRLRDDRMLREVVAPKFDEDQSWTLPGIEAQMLVTWVPVPKPPVPPGQKAPPENLWVPMGSPKGLDQIRAGFAKRDEIAWVATHRHSPQGNEPYVFGYIFRYAIDLPEGATAFVLPTDARVRIFAATVAAEPGGTAKAAGVFYAPDLGPAPAPRAPATPTPGVTK